MLFDPDDFLGLVLGLVFGALTGAGFTIALLLLGQGWVSIVALPATLLVCGTFGAWLDYFGRA